MISARMIADSISSQGIRISTMELRYPKFIHGEFMTHRVFSRNARSSRAVPVHKMLMEIAADPVEPAAWLQNKPGMQATEPMEPKVAEAARADWREGARRAAELAHRLGEFGLHKMWANRVIEPYAHIDVVVTSTYWNNFYGLRIHEDAQPEIRILAEKARAAHLASTPRPLQPGRWHLPYVVPDDIDNFLPPGNPQGLTPHEQMLRMSVARCARVSYKSFDTSKHPTIEEDLKLYDRLVGSTPLHASPTEHQATPDEKAISQHGLVWGHKEEWGNFFGWRQYRKMLPGESGTRHDCGVPGVL